jgi:hypothetical protein
MSSALVRGSHTAYARVVHPRGKVSLGQLLAGLTILSISAGPAIVISYKDRGLPVLLAFLPMTLLFLHLVHTACQMRHRALRLALLGLTLLFFRALIGADTGYGLNVVMNLTFGLLGGYLLAAASRLRTASRFTPVDLGLACFLIATSFQVLSQRLGYAGGAFHHSLILPWGRSNLVAAVLAIATMLYTRRLMLSRPRLLLWTPVAPAALAAIAILSRGAIGATLFGLILAIHRFGLARQARRTIGRPVVAVLGLSVMMGLTILAFGAVADARQGYATQAAAVTARQDLWELAWNEFLDSPVIGSGFGALRDLTIPSIGEASSFAHNFILSMLQQAGLLGLPILIAFYWLLWRRYRSAQNWSTVALVGMVLFLTFVEIVIESPVAGMFSWYAIWSND